MLALVEVNNADAGHRQPRTTDAGAAMGAMVLVKPVVEDRFDGWRTYAAQVVLVAGWVGLFAYCAAYLTEDMPFRASPLQTLGEPLIDRIEDLPRQSDGVGDGIAAAEPVAPAPMTVATEPTAPATPVHPTMPSAAPRPVAAGPDYVGTWGPTAAACGSPARRHGYVPATITPERARAGETVCSFRNTHRNGNAWAMTADCGDRDRRWSSQVKLLVEGDHLTWTSAWGTSAYVRCNRRAG
jgi:hypothetical protein